LLPSLQKRGFGWIKPDSIKNELDRLKNQKQKTGRVVKNEIAAVPAATKFEHGFKISNGLLFG
jgi:hypothetical protein